MENCAEKMTGFADAKCASEDSVIVRSGPRRRNSLRVKNRRDFISDEESERIEGTKMLDEKSIPRNVPGHVAAISTCLVVRIVRAVRELKIRSLASGLLQETHLQSPDLHLDHLRVHAKSRI